MPETTYNYDLQLDFPNQAIQPDVLTAEIEASSITTALVGITIVNDDVDITFVDALSPTDKNTLDLVVANHQGEDLAPPVQRVNSEGESTNSTTTYEEKVSLDSGPLAEGDYLITWYCEISTDTFVSGSGVFAQLVYNGVERGFSSTSQDIYLSFSGSATVFANTGETPTLALNFRRVGASNTAKIRRARMSIALLPAETGGGPS